MDAVVTATIPSSSCTTNSLDKNCTNTIICVSSSPVHDTCSYVVLHLHRVSKSDLILPNLVPFSIAIKIQVAIEDDMCSGGMNMLQAVHLRFKFSGARYIQHMHRVSKSDHSSKHHVVLDRYQDSGSD
jgi:hypothetical protein